MRVPLRTAQVEKLTAVVGGFIVAFMHKPLTGHERIYVDPPREWVKNLRFFWKLRTALNGLRRPSLLFQNILLEILTESLGFKKFASTPTVVHHTETSVKSLVQVDDPLCIGGQIQVDNLVTAL